MTLIRKVIAEFITGLQFLTRIHLVNQEEITPEGFGGSVKFFPVVGLVIGLLLAGFYTASTKYLPIHLLAALIIGLELIITGGLHGDGMMDSVDGIFSVRSPERMLEIMKDSRVGANGVMAFILVFVLKWSMILDLLPLTSWQPFFLMPIIGRFAMVLGITLFPYARSAGMGKAFADFSGHSSLIVAGVSTLLIVFPFGKVAVISLVVASILAIGLARKVTQLLGGLTGDVYGLLVEVSQLAVLAVFLLARQWLIFWIN